MVSSKYMRMEDIKNKENRILSQKTQSLLNAATQISDTLHQLEKESFGPINTVSKAVSTIDKQHAEVVEVNTLERSVDLVAQDQSKIVLNQDLKTEGKPSRKVDPKVLNDSKIVTLKNANDEDRETTTYYHASTTSTNPSLPKAGAENAVSLLGRIASLEATLASRNEESGVEKNTSNATVLSSKKQNHDTQMRSSRMEMELKSLKEQNGSLRSENRRMNELESSLRARIVELSQPAQSQVSPLSPSDLVNQERLLQRLDESLSWIAVHGAESKMNAATTKCLRLYNDAIEPLKKIVKGATDTNPMNVLSLCKGVADVVCTSFEHVWKISKDSSLLDTRIDQLRIESLSVNKDATETIKELSISHEQSVHTLSTSKRQAEQQLFALTEKYQQLKTIHLDVVQQNVELNENIQRLNEIAHRPVVHPEVVLLPATIDSSAEIQIEGLQKRNFDLNAHIESLAGTIEAWKAENDALQKDLLSLRQDRTVLETEKLENLKKLSDLENQVQDEKLKCEKAGEAVKCLDQSLQLAQKSRHEKKDSTAELGKSFEHQLNAIKQQLAQSTTSDPRSEVQVMKFLQEMDGKATKIIELECSLKEHEALTEKVEEINERLETKLEQAKDKFQVRESTWLEKLKKTRVNQSMIQKELDTAKQQLHRYHDQWVGIHALLELPDGNSEIHPLGFSTLFNAIHAKTAHAAENCRVLELSLIQTKGSFEATSKDLSIQIKQLETLGTESNHTREKLVVSSSEKSKLEMEIKALQSKVDDALRGKGEANERLKLVMARMVEYVQQEN